MNKIKLGAEVFVIDERALEEKEDKAKVKDVIIKGYIAEIKTIVTTLSGFNGEINNKIINQVKKGVENGKRLIITVVTETKEVATVPESEVFFTVEDAKKFIIKDAKEVSDKASAIIKNFK